MDSESVGDPGEKTERTGVGDLSPLAVGFVTLVALLFYFWISDALFPADTGRYRMSSAQVTGMALTYSATPAFLLAALIYAQRRTRAALDLVARSGCVSREAAARGAEKVSVGPVQSFAMTILGLALGALQIGWPAIFENLGTPNQWMVVSIAVGNLLTWVVVVHVTLRRVLASLELWRLGRDEARIDLFRLDTLLPFGRIGVVHLLMVTIAVSLSAFQSLDAEVRMENYAWALAAGIPSGLVLLLLPMVGVRGRVREAKRIALEGLDEAIANADRSLEPDALRYLGDLLQQRKAVQQTREWPLDTTAISRIAIYFVIPPIAWVCGALVEVFVQEAL